jgi:hypothetical protein
VKHERRKDPEFVRLAKARGFYSEELMKKADSPGPNERGKKMGKGRPTGIKRQDVTHAGPGVTYITFEEEQVPVLNYDPNSYPEILELGHGRRDLRLYGYFDGDEFMEVDREVIW